MEAVAVECSCPEPQEYHGSHPAIVMAGETVWEGRKVDQGYMDRTDAEEVAEERLRSRLGLLLADQFAVKGIDT